MIGQIYDMLEYLRNDFLFLYNDCLKKHPHPKIYYERGMIHMHSGDIEGALQNISDLMELAESEKFKDQDILTSEMYQQEGEFYAEVGMYDKAIESLNRAISKDPKNLEAYFQRASAYFEIGDFDRSIEDYLISKKQTRYIPNSLPSLEFIDAFSAAAINSTCEGVCDFLPSLCHTTYGLGQCLWAFSDHPLDSTAHFAAACYEMGQIAAGYLATIDKQKLNQYADELVALYERFYDLSDKEKGELIGQTVGKYGIEILAGMTMMKGVVFFKKLREANRICTLEAMIASPTTKARILEQATLHNAKRARFFETAKIHWDRQNKHVRGSHNYDSLQKKSIWTHPDAEGLLKKHAGTGRSDRGTIGQPGYKEIVDFKENIGIWKNLDGESLSTTKGTIHYSKKGAHIVPAHPNSKIW